jgi:hypothetical protein
MKKLTLALVLIAAFCLLAVSPAMAYTYNTVTDPYKFTSGNVTAKYTFGIAGKNVVSFPTATYKPSIAPTLDKTFTITAMSSMTSSIGGTYYKAKFPWEL